jgi:hypothetical protein
MTQFDEHFYVVVTYLLTARVEEKKKKKKTCLSTADQHSTNTHCSNFRLVEFRQIMSNGL